MRESLWGISEKDIPLDKSPPVSYCVWAFMALGEQGQSEDSYKLSRQAKLDWPMSGSTEAM